VPETIAITVVTISAAVHFFTASPKERVQPIVIKQWLTLLREQCLPSRWLAMDVYLDFDIPAFRLHVTIYCHV
jgi:hypothetical protein